MPEPNRHYSSIRNALLFIASLPGLLQLRFCFGDLPANLFAALSHTFGHTAFLLLIVALAITPLRRWLTFLFRLTRIKWGKRLADWNFLIRLRRPIGIYAFIYMLLHILTYLYLELGFIWAELVYEIQHREFLLPGLLAAVLMSLLALTSPNWCRRKMGRWWRRLHRGIYILAPLAGLHYLWFAKVTERLPWLYLTIIFILLAHRVVVASIKRLSRNDDIGMEVIRKTSRETAEQNST